MATNDLYEAGLAKRKKVLGEAHVERSLAAASEFARPMQELVTEYCNLAMLTALNRGHELSGHVKGAVSNGVTEDEIREVLMQTAIYCGVPAALESFRIAEKTLADLRADDE